MRVLWLNTRCFPSVGRKLGFPPSYAGAALELAAQTLCERERDCTLCVAYSDERRFDVMIDGIRHISYYAGNYYDMRKVDKCAAARLKVIIDDFNPDIIHIHGTEAIYGAFPIDTYCGKPVVVSIQGVLSACGIHLTGGLSPRETLRAHLNLSAFFHRATLWSDQSYWREVRAVQEKRIFEQHCHFIGRTDWDRWCVEWFGTGNKYYHVNETLRPEFFEVSWNRANIRPHTIYCSAAAGYPLKAVHWLLRAMAVLKGEFPDVQLRVAAAEHLNGGCGLRERLVGGTYSLYLRQLIADLGLKNNVVALPALYPDDIVKELQKAELFVLPSLCENSSNSLGEAMLVGTPAIATYAGGTPSILKDRAEGLLVPPYDPFALAGAIRTMFNSPNRADEYARAAKETALKRHDRIANASTLMAVYRRICGSSRS